VETLSYLTEFVLALVLAPLLPGIVRRVKARVGGRTGAPLLQVYRDLWKLLHKGQVVSDSVSPVFRLAPPAILASSLLALSLVCGVDGGPISFAGDFLLLLGLFSAGRFFLMLAALDTSSSFEGMGASREATFAALTEIVLMLSLGGSLLAAGGHAATLRTLCQGLPHYGTQAATALLAAAFFAAFLAENGRIPVDDPTTHLELTMIHEAMILDHSGPDLAFLEYAGCLKLWALGALTTSILLPTVDIFWLRIVLSVGGVASTALLTGVIESSLARLRMPRVPQLLLGAAGLSLLAIFLLVWR